ncbi:hypothetical protein BOTCAL_0020g00060 [Botryotinia calthae]|uniref:Uncharacterized protein n=1 Tax=Botryotinia calthae TaxID=38488 RepID=A0A4Y8DEY6_9HELO|nr:hypothetical protein BOTCAL_0020g00060 [Botryotinia calthae]
MANGTVDEQATLGKPNDDLFSEVPQSNNVEKPDTPSSSSTNSPPKKDYNYFDTEKVKRYTCPYCKDTYITTPESMSHIAPVDMEQEEVLKYPHCTAPSIRETLEFTEEIIEARPRRSYIPVYTGKKRFCCPHCKRAFNTTMEAMLTLIPEITEQGELRTCLYCRKPSLKTTLESYSDTIKSSASNSGIQPPRQPPSPYQASTDTPSSQILKGAIHTPASQNSPDQQSAFQITIDQRSAIQRNKNQHPIFQTTLNQQATFQSSSDEQPASDSNSHKQSTFQYDLYQQKPAVHPKSNQQSIPGIKTDPELASKRSSQIGPRRSFICGSCGMRFADFITRFEHRDLICRYRLWYFCPEPNCWFHRDNEVGFWQLGNLWLHLPARHNYPHQSRFSLTYRGEVRDPYGIDGWRAL